MFKTEPGPDRYKLGFQSEVLSNFDFLIKEYGFQCVKIEVTFIRYESQKAFVNIYHGRASFELGFEIGLLSQNSDVPENYFTLLEIIELEGALVETGYRYFQTNESERLKEYLHKLVELVKKYAKNALLGDISTFKKLSLIQQQNSDNYIKDTELNRVRPEAEEAWRNKKYKYYIELFEPIEKYLSINEIRKLEYARKHLDKI